MLYWDIHTSKKLYPQYLQSKKEQIKNNSDFSMNYQRRAYSKVLNKNTPTIIWDVRVLSTLFPKVLFNFLEHSPNHIGPYISQFPLPLEWLKPQFLQAMFKSSLSWFLFIIVSHDLKKCSFSHQRDQNLTERLYSIKFCLLSTAVH